MLDSLEGKAKGEKDLLDSATDRLKSLKDRVNMAKVVKLAATTALTMTIPSLSDLASIFESGNTSEEPTLQGFRDEFAAFLSEEALSHVRLVVVLVDDLDRSLPDMVVESLEAIKLFLAVERMAFVVAADEDNVARAIGQRLQSTGQPTTARQYLEKIVQIPFRIPALSRQMTEEYLALLLLSDSCDVDALATHARSSRDSVDSLAARLAPFVPDELMANVRLATRIGRILHRHTGGNPRRLKRFLNAFWLRTAIAQSRGVELADDACAKLMVAEMIYPDFFGQMLGWLSSGTLGDNIRKVEEGEASYGEHIVQWGRLQPSMQGVDLQSYLLLAASLRSEIVEEAALPAKLRAVADGLIELSVTRRRQAISSALKMESESLSILGRFVAGQLSHERSPERQGELSGVLSRLARDKAVGRTIAAELRAMDPGSVLTPTPVGLLANTMQPELVKIVEDWSLDPAVRDRTRRAAAEAVRRGE